MFEINFGPGIFLPSHQPQPVVKKLGAGEFYYFAISSALEGKTKETKTFTDVKQASDYARKKLSEHRLLSSSIGQIGSEIFLDKGVVKLSSPFKSAQEALKEDMKQGSVGFVIHIDR